MTSEPQEEHASLLKEYRELPPHLWLQTLNLLILVEGAMLEVSGI